MNGRGKKRLMQRKKERPECERKKEIKERKKERKKAGK